MEHSRVNYSHTNTVYTDIESEQDVPAVFHDSKAALAHDIPTIFQITFVKVNLSRVNDRVLG
jgi:hypothetical protein